MLRRSMRAGWYAIVATGHGSIPCAHSCSTATAGQFVRGMAIFTVARGGLMYEASVGGQRFSFRPQ